MPIFQRLKKECKSCGTNANQSQDPICSVCGGSNFSEKLESFCAKCDRAAVNGSCATCDQSLRQPQAEINGLPSRPTGKTTPEKQPHLKPSKPGSGEEMERVCLNCGTAERDETKNDCHVCGGTKFGEQVVKNPTSRLRLPPPPFPETYPLGPASESGVRCAKCGLPSPQSLCEACASKAKLKPRKPKTPPSPVPVPTPIPAGRGRNRFRTKALEDLIGLIVHQLNTSIFSRSHDYPLVVRLMDKDDSMETDEIEISFSYLPEPEILHLDQAVKYRLPRPKTFKHKVHPAREFALHMEAMQINREPITKTQLDSMRSVIRATDSVANGLNPVGFARRALELFVRLGCWYFALLGLSVTFGSIALLYYKGFAELFCGVPFIFALVWAPFFLCKSWYRRLKTKREFAIEVRDVLSRFAD